jgi:hypothetical protein
MNDIIERLRDGDLLPRDRMETANEIERLREIDKLREAAFKAYAEQEKKDRAEIERLQGEVAAEIERLRANEDLQMRRAIKAESEIGGLRAERDKIKRDFADLQIEAARLRADNAKLRALLRELIEWSNNSQQYVWQKARRALEEAHNESP